MNKHGTENGIKLKITFIENMIIKKSKTTHNSSQSFKQIKKYSTFAYEKT